MERKVGQEKEWPAAFLSSSCLLLQNAMMPCILDRADERSRTRTSSNIAILLTGLWPVVQRGSDLSYSRILDSLPSPPTQSEMNLLSPLENITPYHD